MRSRSTLRPLTSLLLAASALLAAGEGRDAAAEVRVFEATLDLATDEEGPPDPNPPFDLFRHTRFSYPYTLRETLTGRQSVVRYRALILENEHLRCVVLPDLGGHLYNCVDNANGADLFYANRSLRKAQIGYRGAWVAFGVEFNFPVSHNWVSLSPVDFATRTNEDGSASIWVANVDRVYGMQWRVELRLRPGAAVLEQRVALYNPSPVRRRFYWWNNAGVRVRDESRIAYPMRFTASHGFREVDTWPVDSKGVDLSRVGNHLHAGLPLRPRQPRRVHGCLSSVEPHRRRPLLVPRGRSHQEDLVVGRRRRRSGLEEGALRRSERLRRDPGRALP
jgi:hypothetical protein